MVSKYKIYFFITFTLKFNLKWVFFQYTCAVFDLICIHDSATNSPTICQVKIMDVRKQFQTKMFHVKFSHLFVSQKLHFDTWRSKLVPSIKFVLLFFLYSHYIILCLIDKQVCIKLLIKINSLKRILRYNSFVNCLKFLLLSVV